MEMPLRSKPLHKNISSTEACEDFIRWYLESQLRYLVRGTKEQDINGLKCFSAGISCYNAVHCIMVIWRREQYRIAVFSELDKGPGAPAP